MTFRVTEYGGGYGSGRPFSVIPSLPSIRTQTVSIGSSALVLNLSSVTTFIYVDADVGVHMFLGSSVSTGLAQAGSSTGAFGGSTGTAGLGGIQRIPANVAPMPFFVHPYARISILST